ncbi:MAG: hypothetical protein WBE34_16910 [Candidatus Nitrosopolaris sp.]
MSIDTGKHNTKCASFNDDAICEVESPRLIMKTLTPQTLPKVTPSMSPQSVQDLLV